MFVATHRVQFHETDMAGIVHFSNFYRYMEEAEHAYLRSLGLSVSMTLPDGRVIGWPRVRTKCAFLAPAYFEDVIEIRLRLTRRGVKSLNFDVDFYRGDTKLAYGTLKTACCVVSHGKPLESIEIPPDIAAKLIEEGGTDEEE